jgi:hypothetical protein
MISGTIRVNMFKGIDRLPGIPLDGLATEFIRAICKDWNGVQSYLPPDCNIGISDKQKKALNGIYFTACEWHRTIQSQCISMDFHIYIDPPNAKFDATRMDPRLRGGAKPMSIICTEAFGLLSSVAGGKKKSPEYVYKRRTQVLSASFFQQ